MHRQCGNGHEPCPVCEFIEFCRKKRKQFIFICCGETFKNSVSDLDVSSFRIGEDFIFDVQSYAPKGDKTKGGKH